MSAAMLAAGATIGAGCALIVRGLFPPRPTLSELFDELRTPRAAVPDPGDAHDPADPASTSGAGWLARLGRPGVARLTRAGFPRAGVRADLHLLERPEQVHVAEQAATAVLGLVLPALAAGLLAVAGVGVGFVVPAWTCLLLAALGFFVPDLVVRADAAARRAEFTHALGAFLDLVVIGLAGGAGVDAALSHAADTGHGRAFDRIRGALHLARLTRTTPWTGLADLGDQLRVPALREVAATVALAGTEGAKVRASLAAKASALRLREHATAEADSVAATERMTLPVTVMLAGFLLFIAYPAVVNVLAL